MAAATLEPSPPRRPVSTSGELQKVARLINVSHLHRLLSIVSDRGGGRARMATLRKSGAACFIRAICLLFGKNIQYNFLLLSDFCSCIFTNYYGANSYDRCNKQKRRLCAPRASPSLGLKVTDLRLDSTISLGKTNSPGPHEPKSVTQLGDASVQRREQIPAARLRRLEKGFGTRAKPVKAAY